MKTDLKTTDLRIGQRVEVVGTDEVVRQGTVGTVKLIPCCSGTNDQVLISIYPASVWVHVGALEVSK